MSQSGATALTDDGFASAELPPAGGVLMRKWRDAQAAIEADLKAVAGCRADAACGSAGPARLMAIADEARVHAGRARLGHINRAVNLAIRPARDSVRHGVSDRWSAPLETLAEGQGDCEDYALLKYAALREAGYEASDLRLLIVRLPAAQEDHAVLAARFDGRWLVLDNRRFALIDAADLDAVPLFAFESDLKTFAKTQRTFPAAQERLWNRP